MVSSYRPATRPALIALMGLVLLSPLAAQQIHLRTLAATGTTEQIRAALEAGADFNDHDYTGVTALMAAAATNRDPGVVLVLIRYGAVVDARDRNGETALMLAAERNGDASVVAELLKGGAALENRDLFGRTPLMHAAMDNPSVPVTDALLKAGARVNARDSYGLSALLYAVWVGQNAEVALTLLGAGADATARTNSGRTLMDLARDNPRVRGDAALLRQLQEAVDGTRSSAQRPLAGGPSAGGAPS